jgi:hypothetical protein
MPRQLRTRSRPLGECRLFQPRSSNHHRADGGKDHYPAPLLGDCTYFVRPPHVEGDSALVRVASGCDNNWQGLLQVHEFLLRKRVAGWTVERREVVLIT